MIKSTQFILLLLLIFLAPSLIWSQIELEQIIPGMTQVNYMQIQDDNRDLRDFNGDGAPDLAFFETSSGDDSLFIRIVITGSDEEVLVKAVNGGGLYNSESWVIIGFTELDGNPEFKEIILAEKKGRRRFVNPVVLAVDGLDFLVWQAIWAGNGKALLGVAQMDDDPCKEIITSDPAWPQVEIYGKKI